jgi:hypothetical protein
MELILCNSIRDLEKAVPIDALEQRVNISTLNVGTILGGSWKRAVSRTRNRALWR